MNFLQRIFRPRAAKAGEGEYRDGPWMTSAGLLPHSWGSYANYWQMGYDPISGAGSSAIVQACVSAYAQTVAMCPGSHWRTNADGGREKVTSSALYRVLRKPNAYQSPSDFLLNATSRLYREGNAYALAIRNDRYEISELHIMPYGEAYVAPTGDVFYSLSGNEVIERQIDRRLPLVPSRDVLHVRLETPRSPLKGETPLTVAMLDIALSNSMARQALAFFENQSRPSGTLNTEMKLSPADVQELRERWEEQSRGLNAGRTPILTAGLKWQPMATPAKDSMLAEVMKITEQNVALAYRVPLQILGIGGTPFASTEALMQAWIGMGLGFALNHIEQAFDGLFGLAGGEQEYVELDTSILLRSSFNERMDGLAKAVQGAIMSPDEARRTEGLPRVAGGHGEQPRVQQQVVPLSWHAEQAALSAAEPAVADPVEEEPRDFEALILAAARRHETREHSGA